MLIQRRQAESQKIQFYATFVNIRDENTREIDSSGYSPVVLADEQRVMQVLLGLQSNALKFTDKGKVEVRVSIEKKGRAKYLLLEVIDTGQGIPYEDQNKLFKLFGFLQSGQKKNKNGVGLGLAISKMIVEQYEGMISLESEPGVGSNFFFRVKLNN